MPDELRQRKYKKYQLLETSLRYQGGEFFENSTLHGVRFIAEKDRPIYERLMWFIFVSIGAIVTMIIIVSLWEKFQTNPTITGLDTDFHNWDVPFPGISVCPKNPVNQESVEEEVKKRWGEDLTEQKRAYYESFLHTIGNFSFNNFKYIDNFKSDPSLPQDNLKDIAYSVLAKCETVLSDCQWKGEEINCCELFRPTFTEKGFCYSFNTRNSEKNWPGKPPGVSSEEDFKVKEIYETDSKWTVFFVGDNITITFISYDIYIHNADELPSVEMAPQHVWTMTTNKILFAARMTYTTNDTRQLTTKQRKCIFKDEEKLSTYPEYSYWACVTDCRLKYSMEKCSCVPFFYLKVPGFPYCKLDGLICLVQHVVTMKKRLNCPCELGCDNTVYEVEKLNDGQAGEDSELEIGFVSWPMIRYKREVLFGWVDLLVSFGGIAGLFLGFSLLSGVEIVYYFTLRAACMLHQDEGKLAEIKSQEVNRPRGKIDLSLKPHFGSDEKKSLNDNYINNVLNVGSQSKKALKAPAVPFLN